MFNRRKASRNGINQDEEIWTQIGGEDLSAENPPSLSGRFNPFDEENNLSEQPPSNNDEEVRKRKKIIFSIFAVIIAFLLIYVFFLSDPGSSEVGENSNESTQSVESPTNSFSGVVVNEQIGKEYSGSDDGNPINGTGAILAFDYDYYVNRDGEEALKHFNPNSSSYDGAYIQTHINKVPSGTTYEISVIPERLGEKYNVKLTLNIPGYDPVSYDQEFITMEKDGIFYVKNFTSKKSSGR